MLWACKKPVCFVIVSLHPCHVKDGTGNLDLPFLVLLNFYTSPGGLELSYLIHMTVDVLSERRSWDTGGPATGEVPVTIGVILTGVDETSVVLRQWMSCYSGGLATVEVMGQWMSCYSGGLATVEVMWQWRSCYSCHQSACKAEVMPPAITDYGRDNDDGQQQHYLQVTESETRLYRVMELVEDQQL